VEEFLSQYAHVRYILETNVGLSHARNRGWQEARGEYVGYLDDDALAQPGWLETASRVISAIHPAILGGPILPFYRSPKPCWYKDAYATSIVSDTPKALEKDYISGGNSFNCKTTLQKLNGFKTDFGMSGGKIGYGEETEFQMRLRKSYPDEIMYYHPGIVIRHLVPKHKMQFRWIFRSRFESGRAFRHIQYDPSKRTRLLSAVANFLRVLKSLAGVFFCMLWRDPEKHPYAQNYIYEVVAPVFFVLGNSLENIHIAIKEMLP